MGIQKLKWSNFSAVQQLSLKKRQEILLKFGNKMTKQLGGE